MINNTTAAQPWYNDLQNCYVDPTNPYNPYPTTMPCPPYQITDQPRYIPCPPLTTVAYPQTVIAATTTTNPTPDEEKPKPSSTFAPFILALSEQDKADLEAMIRRVIKEEVESVVCDVLGDRDEADRRERWQDE